VRSGVGLRVVRFRVGGRRFAALVEDVGSAAPDGLTPAESEILQLLRSGLTNQAIASERGTSLRTVAIQVSSLLRKLGVSSRVELTLAKSPSHE